MSEIEEFQVGDRVRATITCPAVLAGTCGMVVRILDVDTSWPIDVSWDGDDPDIGGWPAALHEIEKVTE